MLISLPTRFEAKVSAIEESCDLKSLSVAELISKLQTHEQRSNMRDEGIIEGAFQARQKGKQLVKEGKKSGNDKTINKRNFKTKGKKGRFPPRNICQRDNHMEKDCWYKDKGSI
ncbi:hypothetical protein MANES_11G002850v8 [Manihot esculenta]|uniref:Uncharacterized protein n=1 Tax=Manihot esculenta TaxID=3983 RepID=A0ACB7GTM7_MANES|nr:hypothetical protein MANES_11G002850v8 [Manihot esculenta]